MDESQRFSGKTLVVTGGGQGLGAAVARRASAEGAQVVVVDINGDMASQVASDLPGEAISVEADVSVSSAVEGYISAALEKFGRVDCVHNNAGIIGSIAPIIETSDESYARTLSINASGMFYSTRAAFRAMADAGGGAIVNTSSVMGLMGAPGLAPYVMTKHAIIGLTKSVALEGGKLGIRANVVCPGAIDTPMNRQSEALAGGGDIARGREIIESLVSIGRYADPDEVAALVLWLLSDEASYVNGGTFTVDAAQTAGSAVLD